MNKGVLRILHISDLHQRIPSHGSDWRRHEVLGKAWEKNLVDIASEGPIDLVCLTGDAAFCGRREEYEAATPFLLNSLALLGLGPERLLLVPGNHDVDWEVASAEYRVMRAAVDRNVDRARLSRWLAGDAPPDALDPAWRDAILTRQAAYQRWVVEDLGLPWLDPKASKHGRLGYRRTIEIRDLPPVQIVGLNTAWLSGDADGAGKLLVTDDQLMLLLTDNGRELAAPRIVLMHHSFTDLLDGRDALRRLAGRSDLVLRGHLHAADSGHYMFDPQRSFIEFAATSLFDSEQENLFRNGCQVITLKIGEPTLSGRTRYRGWSDKGGHWFDDNSVHENVKNGHLSWGLQDSEQGLFASSTSLARLGHRGGDSVADFLRALRQRVSREGITDRMIQPDRVYVSQPGKALTGSDERIEMLSVMKDFWQGHRRRVAVLGNYGMGKTFFALRSAIQQIDAFHDPATRRIPVYFRLRDFDYSQVTSVERPLSKDIIDQILDSLIALDLPLITRAQFVELIHAGRFGFILDGLDELRLRRDVDWQTALAPLLAIEVAPCLTTSRTAYIDDKKRALAGWEAFELQEWADAEWRQYVARCERELSDVGGGDAFLELVASRKHLARLTTRPLWCFMIVTVRNRIAECDDLGMADLYQYFLDEMLDRVTRRDLVVDQFLTSTRKYIALERFAETCSLAARPSLPKRNFVDLVSAMFLEVGLSEIESFATREMKVYSFLNCDTHDNYSFGHASFGEYFVAASVARSLMTGIVAAGRSGRTVYLPPHAFVFDRDLTADQMAFLSGILASERALEGLAMLPRDAPEDAVAVGLEPFVRAQLQNRRASKTLRRNLLLLFLGYLRRDKDSRPAIHRLVLRDAQLPKENLAGCDLVQVDFTGANLAGANFRESTLRACTFSRATLDAADFEGADMAGADLRYIEPPLAIPRLAGARNLDQMIVDPATAALLKHAAG